MLTFNNIGVFDTLDIFGTNATFIAYVALQSMSQWFFLNCIYFWYHIRILLAIVLTNL